MTAADLDTVFEWRPIAEAPEIVRELAAHVVSELGRSRYRLVHETEIVDGRPILRTWVLWTGWDAGSPVTHYLSAPLPDAPEGR